MALSLALQDIREKKYDVMIPVGLPTPMATPGPVASTSTAHPTFPATRPAVPATPPAVTATPHAVPATPHAGRRGRRRRHEDEDDGMSPIVKFQNSSYRSTSGFQWSCQPQTSATTRTAARDIMPAFTPGPTPEVSNADTPEKCFTLFFEDQIIDEIVTWTNIRIDAEATKYQRRTAAVQRTTAAEVRTILEIFIFSGCQMNNHLSTKEMWNPGTGAPVYRAAMSEGHFCSSLPVCDLMTLTNGGKDRPWTNLLPVEKYGTYSLTTVKSFMCPGKI